MKPHHWVKLVVTLAVGGVIGYMIGKNSKTAPAAVVVTK
jgi:hypothetical protein